MSSLVVREFNGKQIEQRPDDGYMDATAMCKATGKKWSHYWANTTTKDFVQALAESTGIPAESLVEMQSGRGGGTYVHPKLAMHLAQWCSPKFAVVVSGWVLDILTTGRAELAPTPADPILAMIETAKATYLMQVEQAKKLAAVESKVDAVQQTASRALQQATAAQKTADSQYGYFTVLAYAKRTGREISVGEASRVGKCLSDRLRAAGGEPQKISDPRFGFVNLYPENLLIDHFGD